MLPLRLVRMRSRAPRTSAISILASSKLTPRILTKTSKMLWARLQVQCALAVPSFHRHDALRSADAAEHLRMLDYTFVRGRFVNNN